MAMSCKMIIKKPRAFTLVEILVVVGIMMLLMAIALPAFDAMTSGSGVKAGGRGIAQALKLSRSYSISNRQYVALVFPMFGKNYDFRIYPDEHYGWGEVAAPDPDTALSYRAGLYAEFKGRTYPDASKSGFDAAKYYNKAYRPCVVEKFYDRFNHPHYKFKYWIPGEKWRFLPKGIAIVGMGGGKAPRNGCITCTFFDSRGVLHEEQYVSTPILKVNYTDIGGKRVGDDCDDKDDFTPGVIFSPAGKNGAASCDIVLGEATFTGDNLLLTNPDPDSWGTVMINDRGKVTFMAHRKSGMAW